MSTLTKLLRHLIASNGYDKPFPDSEPMPVVSTSGIPVTDTLSQPQSGFTTPEAGYRATRPQFPVFDRSLLDTTMNPATMTNTVESRPTIPLSGSPPIPSAPDIRFPETAIGQPPTRTGPTPPFSQAFKKVSPWKAFFQTLMENLGPSMQQAAQGARGGRMDAGDFFSGLAGAGGAGVGAAFNPGRVQEQNELREVDKRRQQEGQGLEAEAARGKIQDAALDREYRQEQILAARRKPGEQEAKAKAKAQTAGQSAIFRNLGLYRGQKFDVNNPRHNDFLMRAEQAGVFIDPDEWNNATGNEAVVIMVDPDNPTQTRRVMVNKATGEQTVLGQGGYVQPVNPETGMTSYQKGSLDLGRTREAGTESRFGRGQAATESRFTRSQASDGTSSGTARPSTRADRTAAQSLLNQERDLRTAAASADTVEKRDALNSQADEVKADLLARFPDAVEEVDASTVDRSGMWPKTTPKTKLRMRGASAPQGRASGVKYSPQQQDYYSKMISVGATPAEAAEAVRLKYGK